MNGDDDEIKRIPQIGSLESDPAFNQGNPPRIVRSNETSMTFNAVQSLDGPVRNLFINVDKSREGSVVEKPFKGSEISTTAPNNFTSVLTFGGG